MEALVAGDDEALLQSYREGDPTFRSAIEQAPEEDGERMRMLVTRRDEHIVSLPEPEPAEGDAEPTPRDFQREWQESLQAPVTEDVPGYVKAGLAEMRDGRLNVTPSSRPRSTRR